jgi:hypothetical protein
MRTGYKSLWKWSPKQQRKGRGQASRNPPSSPAEQEVYVEVPGVGKCLLVSQSQLRQMRKRREGGG